MEIKKKVVHVGPKFLSFINVQLNTLRGYDLMALELLQNADDAKAKTITFNICDDALYVENDSTFSSCLDRTSEDECSWSIEKNAKKCDWHAFVDIASGNKPNLQEELIGRFGLGFTSVYQITDRPVIICDGTQLTIVPENQTGEYAKAAMKPGTEFILPWALKPNSAVRSKLTNTEVIEVGDFEKITEAICKGTEQALLFIKNVRTIRILRNSLEVKCFQIQDLSPSEKRIITSPEGTKHDWFFASSNSSYELGKLEELYPRQIGNFPRRHKVEIAIPISNIDIKGGLLYAFLPTQKSTGINVHINADFFPHASRTDINFHDANGSDPQALWNATLIANAAKLLANYAEHLIASLGYVRFWNIVRDAHAINDRALERNSLIPPCYSKFWEEFKLHLPTKKLILCESDDKRYRTISEVIIPEGENLKVKRLALLDIGMLPVAGRMSPYKEVLELLGTEKLTFENLVMGLANCAWVKNSQSGSHIAKSLIESRYLPLWELLNDLAPKEIAGIINSDLVKRLSKLPILVSLQNFPLTIEKSIVVEGRISPANLLSIFPELGIVNRKIDQYPKLRNLCPELSISIAARKLRDYVFMAPEMVLEKKLTHIYKFLIEVTHNRTIMEEDLLLLSSLPIWRSTNGVLISRDQGKILGAFRDPLEQANLIDVSSLEEDSRNFLQNKIKLNAETLSIKNYILDILPHVFSERINSLTSNQYKGLLIELSNHPKEFDDEHVLKKFREMYFIPTRKGVFTRPGEAVFFDTKVSALLGEDFQGWVEDRYIPQGNRSRDFLEKIGVNRHPSISQIVNVWVNIVESRITPIARKRVLGIISYISESKSKWEPNDFSKGMDTLKNLHCLPAVNEGTSWHLPTDLYSPENSSLFATQKLALIVEIENQSKESLSLVCDELRVKVEPEIKLVIAHIRMSQQSQLKITSKVYSFLNRVAKRTNDTESQTALSHLRDTPIYCLTPERYLKPSELYFEDPKLFSPWGYKVSSDLVQFEDLLKLTGVKSRPDCRDLIEVLRQLSEVASAKGVKEGNLENHDIYTICWQQIDLLCIQEEIDLDDIEILATENLFLTRDHSYKSISEVLIQDSEWVENTFKGRFDGYIVNYSDSFPNILRKLDASLVSNCIESTRGGISGDIVHNLEVQGRLHDRRDNIGVILEGLQKDFKRSEIWNSVQVYTVDEVESIWKLIPTSGETRSISVSTPVFFDLRKKELYLALPDYLGDENLNWTPIFREMLHQLLPAVVENSIRNAISTLDAVISRSPAAGKHYLEELGFSFEEKIIQIIGSGGTTETLTTLGTESGEDNKSDLDSNEDTESIPGAMDSGDNSSEEEPGSLIDGDESVEQNLHGENHQLDGDEEAYSSATNQQDAPKSGDEEPLASTTRKGATGATGSSGTPGFSGVTGAIGATSSSGTPGYPGATGSSGTTGKRKQKENSSAYIYVSKSAEDDNAERRARAKENEKISRKYVMEHEKSEGRIATEMSDTNPGYDIESIENDGSGDLRFIEIKSLSGDWGAEGVSISIRQLDWAYRKGKCYWIYIVENINNENRKIHMISDPASHIRAFKFNSAWKDIAKSLALDFEIENDLSNAISEEDLGSEIRHTILGNCFLTEWIPFGKIIKVKLLFDGDDFSKEFTFKPQTMKKING